MQRTGLPSSIFPTVADATFSLSQTTSGNWPGLASFAIDGKAVLLGVDGRLNFDGLGQPPA
jgi:hypothetical protein